MKQQLYTKNSKGRYEPYRDLEPPFGNVLYRKVRHGNRVEYEPHSMSITTDLPEGVWVVTRNTYGYYAVASGQYLRDCFQCSKASDIQDFNLAELGGMDKLAHYLHYHRNEITGNSTYERCCSIVKLIRDYAKEQERENR